MSFLKQKVKLASTSSFRLVASLLVYMCVFFLFLRVYPLESIGGNKKYQISGSESSKQRRHGGRVGTGIQGESPKSGGFHQILRLSTLRTDGPSGEQTFLSLNNTNCKVTNTYLGFPRVTNSQGPLILPCFICFYFCFSYYIHNGRKC